MSVQIPSGNRRRRRAVTAARCIVRFIFRSNFRTTNSGQPSLAWLYQPAVIGASSASIPSGGWVLFCGAEEIRPLRFMLPAAAYMVSDQKYRERSFSRLAVQGVMVRRQNVRHMR